MIDRLRGKCQPIFLCGVTVFLVHRDYMQNMKPTDTLVATVTLDEHTVSQVGPTGNQARSQKRDSIFGTTKRSAFSTNAHSSYILIVLDDVLGPPLEGHLGSSKSPSRALHGDKGVAGRIGRE